MEVGPAVGIVDVTLLGIHLVELHQSLVIDGTRPQTAGTDFSHVSRNGGVVVFLHEIVIDPLGYT